ncbi:hypothetical protein JSQ81_03565 [Sporosarcina sp. Marseille-Q4063]|uniref:hypothetical protein n=1 Tax=Sporosarcina sp. Marseille-Q4063 TaxID=2810514 RepID=UPI001BAF8363|nr:hypothetical protein [Sporosarcina sp. Marseille-Q4063]QUW22672.1 hypothetical protein JSQ81_03565 [Sporosarcina sp. Marseille-Q4063]
MKKLIAILGTVIVLIVLGTFLFKNQDQSNEPEKTTTETNNNEETNSKETDNENAKSDSFTFEPFTLTMEVDDLVEAGKPFEVDASLKNTYNGPVTLKAGSKCTEEVTLVLTPFEEYQEDQSPPACTDLTKDIEVLVGDSLDTKAQFTAEKDGKYIVSAYFANMPLVKKVVTVGTAANFDVKEESSNLGSLQLNVVAESKFEMGAPVYISSALSNMGDNYISLNENSCQLDIEFKVTVDNEVIELPETYGPCEDVNRKFNLQSGDTMNAYTTFIPDKKGKYTVKAHHVNNVTTILEFDVD